METQEKRTISKEGERYPLRDDETIGKEYPPNESAKAHSICFNKAVAYPDYGWRNVILKNGNVLIIVRKNTKTKSNESRW